MKVLCISLALLLAACGQGGGLKIEEAVYRPPLVDGRPGVAYFSIMSSAPDRIISVSSAQAERVEIHTTIEEGGIASMKRVDSVELPAGVPVTFGPGGLHIMVFGPRPAPPGATFPIQITLQSGRSETVAFRPR